MPRIAPSRGTHVLVDRGRPARSGTAACIVPAGEGRTIFALPWYGRTLVGTTDNDFDGDIDHPRPAEDDVDYLLDAVNEFFGISLGARRPGRRLRRGAAADLHRRPEEVGRHLAQGGALRDLLGDADDHRRQADHLAADGEADGRPAGRARGPRGALPHGRDPARDGGARRRTWRRPTGWGRRRSPSSPSATATRRARCSTLAARGPEAGARRSSPAAPTCWPRRSIAARLEQARTRRRRAAAPHPARARRGAQLRDAESVLPVAEALGGELGWSKERVRAEAEGWPRRPRRRASIPPLRPEKRQPPRPQRGSRHMQAMVGSPPGTENSPTCAKPSRA